MEKSIDFLIMAGGTSPEWHKPSISNKVLIPILQVPCIKWVLNAFNNSTNQFSSDINTVLVGTRSLKLEGFTSQCSTFVEVPQTNKLSDNVRTGMEACNGEFVVMTSGDIPCINTQVISNLLINIEKFKDFDLIIPLITKESVEALFPGSQRTYVKIKEGNVKIANAFIVKRSAFHKLEKIMNSFIENRKSVFKLALSFGLINLLKLFIFKSISVEQLEKAFFKAVDINVKGYFTVDAQLAVDLDKESDINNLTEYLRGIE
ncbi:MAG: NTP transferase domain-containing protein [Caldisericia bacterium]|nr:NTP transferase domain-containing protein [Caldisericia bacterium]